MKRLSILLSAALLLAPLPALAGGTQKRVVSTYGDLDKGETEGAAIEASGKITVGYLPQRGDIKATTAFSCLGQGKSVLIGSADEAAIWRVFPNLSAKAGRATRLVKDKDKKGKKVATEATLKVEKVAKLDGVVVSAMATLPGGDVLAATVPGGKIVRVSARGKVTPFAELKVSQIWAIVVHKGRVLVGTGPKGELWSLSTAGKDPKVVLDVEEKDVLSVLAIGDAIVAGVGPSAKIYQVVGDVEGRMMHAFPGGDEVRALTLTKTGLLAAVNAFADRQLSSLDALTKTLNRTSLTGQESSGGLANDRSPAAAARLYHVDLGAKRDVARALEAPWDQWLERDKQYFTSLLTVDDETVLVASSESGKIYRAKGPRDVATVGDFEERQATALCGLPKGPVFATVAHGAGVYQLRAAAATGAKYRSEVFDAAQPASYGAIVLRGDGLQLRARVGPTAAHDRQWSEWKKIPLRKGIAGLRGSLATMPQRRYLELEVTLDSPGAELRSIELFYAPENLAPLLTAVEVDHPRFEDGSNDEPASNMTIKWKVDARDDDDLIYDVRIRPEGSSASEWIKLNDDDTLVTAKELKLDLTTMPDGVYEVEVTASDEPTNGSGKAKSDELRSAPFVVDRQRPEVTGISVKGRKVTAKATDAGGYVHDVAYRIDGGPFRSASPSDGLFDSPAEDLAIELPELTKGKHRIVIRARDSFGNIGTSAIVITL